MIVSSEGFALLLDTHNRKPWYYIPKKIRPPFLASLYQSPKEKEEEIDKNDWSSKLKASQDTD